jgi:twinkle protein
MTDLTRGLRFGETIYIGAGVKMGKSEVVNALAKHLIVDHDLPVFMAKPEEANKKTVKLLLGKVAGHIFHDPKVEFNSDAYDEAAQLVGDKLRMLNLYQHVDWNTLRVDILDAARNGSKAIFIDPITNLTNGVPSGEANTVLQGIAQDLSAIALDHQLLIFIFCHLKAPESGVPHERGGRIYSNQFAGSRAMMRSCNYMIGLEGDKDEDAPIEERNVRKLVLLEDREFGEVGSVPLYWDYKTGLFNEIPRS